MSETSIADEIKALYLGLRGDGFSKKLAAYHVYMEFRDEADMEAYEIRALCREAEEATPDER
jgi:hypothetical protein